MNAATKHDKSERLLNELKSKFSVVDCCHAVIAAKQHLLPPQETAFDFDIKKGRLKPLPPVKPFILFGLSLRDLEAVTRLDDIMSRPHKNFYYFRRRTKATLIGITEERFDVPPGGDLILQKGKSADYVAYAVTAKGRKIASRFKLKLSAKPLSDKVTSSNAMPELRRLLLNPEKLKDAIAWSWKKYPQIWDKLAATCLGCGICTYVCPLCHCFSAEDSIDIAGESCKRCQKWAACTLPEFARVAGGHNFHKTIRERYYNWFYHKFVRAYEEFGEPQCVACGRCQALCPARIDIEKILLDIMQKYKAAKI